MSNLDAVVKHLKQGGVALVETDTNFALACLPWDEKICEKIYLIKKRPPEKPLTLFISNSRDAFELTHFENEKDSKKFQELVNEHWPGPLNFIVNSSDKAPKHRYFDQQSVSLVYNKKQSLNELIDKLESPLALTSANISGVTSNGLIDKEQALENFEGQVLLLEDTDLDRKETTMSSTIVKIENGHAITIRQGDIKIY